MDKFQIINVEGNKKCRREKEIEFLYVRKAMLMGIRKSPSGPTVIVIQKHRQMLKLVCKTLGETKYLHSLSNLCRSFILREREQAQVCQQGKGRGEKDKESQTGSTLSSTEPDAGFDPMTLGL